MLVENPSNDTLAKRELYRRRAGAGLCYCGGPRDGETSWCTACKSKLRNQHYKVVIAAITNYGAICNCCSDNNLAHLTIDHVDGGGCQHMKKVGKGNAFYRWLKNNGYPPGYQVLCMNCNHGRARNGGVCPHKGLMNKVMTYQQAREKKSMLAAMEVYGQSCCNCNESEYLFLCLDHINQDGNIHRSGSGYRRLHDWARQNQYPTTLQTLCLSCNLAKQRPHFNGVTLDGR